MEDGEAVDEEQNELYWTLKNGPALRITSGFRFYANKNDERPEAKADAAEFTYQLFDFGLEEPKSEVIVPDEQEEGETAQAVESGAAAAFASMGVAALAALLFA